MKRKKEAGQRKWLKRKGKQHAHSFEKKIESGAEDVNQE
jgi:hypothetical protein